jgi:hypothetical protein
MYASMMIIALWGIAPSVREEPVWVKDYSVARQLCEKEGRPIAVFIGSGATGWNDLSREHRLDKQARELLAKHYVCLYADRAHEEGRLLAKALEMEDDRGIVISSSSGKLQAFRHEGELRNEDLARYLRRFSAPNLVILHTETNPPPREEFEYVAPARYSSFSVGRSC